MNSQEPYRLSNINLSNIVYTNIKQTDKKKVILIKYQDKHKLRNLVFQTPTLLNINEPKLFLKDNTGYGEIEVALYNTDNNKINKLLIFFNELSNKIINDSKENSEWFNNDLPLHFQKIVRKSDTFKNGLIKLKLLRNSNFETIIQKTNKQKIKMESLNGNTLIKMLLEVYAIWINTNNDFGVFLRPILVSCNKDNYNYKFIPDSDEDVEDDEVPDTEINNNNIFLKSTHNETSQEVYHSELLTNPQYSSTSECIDNNIRDVPSDKNIVNQDIDEQQHDNITNNINLKIDIISDKENIVDDIKLNDQTNRDNDQTNQDNDQTNQDNNENDKLEKLDIEKLNIEDDLSDNDDVENVLRISSPKILNDNNK
jgi:hypothetical protein